MNRDPKLRPGDGARGSFRGNDEVLMAERTYLRPTGFVDAPFGHDGKVARLAGGLGWFASVELIGPDGKELVPVEGIEARLDEAGRSVWANLTSPRAPLKLGE